MAFGLGWWRYYELSSASNRKASDHPPMFTGSCGLCVPDAPM